MIQVDTICSYLDRFAPRRLAEEWDNVGLLVGDRTREVNKVLTCLTLTGSTVQEACGNDVDLVVTHHPLPFRPLKTITADTVPGRLVLELIEHRVAVYSPHTCFDSAEEGINQKTAEGLELVQIRPLIEFENDVDQLGSGRIGTLTAPSTLRELIDRAKCFFQVEVMQYVGQLDTQVSKVAIACGSAGSFLPQAVRRNCDVLITGESSFHTFLEAEAQGVGLILPGHFSSERFGLEHLADVLRKEFEHLEIWAARDERDPLRYA